MRGRFFVAVLALAAFFATVAVPLPPLLAGGMSCCGSGKAKSCCKRKSGPGWVSAGSPCAGQCVCASPASPAAVAASAQTAVPVVAFRPLAVPVQSHTPQFRQVSRYQRPPPRIA